jgi:hypothetical protein
MLSRNTQIPSSEKTTLEFKNIIFEVILSNKFKNGHEIFIALNVSLQICELHGFGISKREVSKRGKNLLDNFTSDVMFLNSKIRVFLENRLGSYQAFLILQI